jgi:hypothetical protein
MKAKDFIEQHYDATPTLIRKPSDAQEGQEQNK